jgi:predicted P-loop ATPase
MDANTFRNLRRRPDTFSNGVITRWGQPKGILANVLKVFELDPIWSQKFWYNELEEAEFIRVGLGNTRAIKDADYVDIVGILNDQYNLEVSVENVASAIKVAAARNTINPVCAYLGEVAPKWDKVPRIDTWLQDYMGAQDTPLYRKMGARWMIAAVARAFEPGCKVDAMLIIQGPQYAGKSTAFKTLASPAWYSETGFNLDNEKDACEKLRGVWLYEIAELAAFTAGKADANKLKNFMSTAVDRYRRSYDRTAASYPRRSVFCGTTNKTQFLNDSTGSRRFWIVQSGPSVDIPGLAAVRDQLWAEAVHRYAAQEVYWLDRSEETERAETAVDYGADDPYVNWMTQFCDVRDNFTALEFWQSLAGNSERTMSNGDAKRISDLVETIGTHKPGRYYINAPGGKSIRQRGYILKAPRPPKPGPFQP